MPIANQEMRRKVASHEAGHAVMAHLRGMEVTQIVVDFENKDMPGYVDWSGIKPFIYFPDGRQRCKAVVRRYQYTNLLINLAGVKAEQLVLGWTNASGFGEDWEHTQALVRQLTDGKDYNVQSAYINRASNAALRILEPHVSALRVITDRLLQNSPMSSDEFLTIMKGFEQ
jgi:hypothetical protein